MQGSRAGEDAGQLTWADDATVQEAFRQLSHEAADTLASLQLAPGEHLLREDVPEVLARAAGRPLSGADAAAVLRCFAIDAGATITWREYFSSWRALQQLAAPAARSSGAKGGRASAAARQQAAPTSQPTTAAAEVGWMHAAAPLPARQRGDGLAGRYVPLRATDVTKGGEGRSTTNQHGMYL